MIKSETRGEVTIVTIDRDEKRNALSVEVARGLRHAIESSFAHSRAIVLNGAGKAFSAGADLGENKLGGGRARAMLLAGMRLERDESVACGMSLPGGMDEAVEVAQRCAGKAPLSIRNIKAEFAPDLFTSEERDAFRAAPFSSEDFAEVARARQEKRPPRFMGR